ncbi:MAG: type II secretion system protein GspG [Phycisphaerales bacterium]|nr:type II secretion system protein GspG [Phycisphaerales bacterium]
MPTARRTAAAASRGFTLLELMIVLIIIAVLGTIVTLNFVGAGDKAKYDATRATMKSVVAALSLYRTNYGTYPPSNPGLNVLVQQNLLNPPVLPTDAWERPLVYMSPGPKGFEGFLLVSWGKDGVETAGPGPDKHSGAIWVGPDTKW